MLTKQQAQEIIELIEGNYLGPAFTKLNEWQVNDTLLGGLEREYLSNRYDYTLSDRLMFFVNKQANTNINSKPIYYDIFFSYSSKNQNEAEEQVKYLREHGISVFFSNDNLKDYAGGSFIGKINDALNNSKHFLLYCTPEAVASTYVQHECETFLGKHISKGKVNKIFIIEGKNFTTKLLEKVNYQYIQTTDIDYILTDVFGKTSKKEQEKQKEYIKKQEQQLTQEQQKLDALEKQKQILLLQKQKKQEQEKLQREIKKLEEEQNTNNKKTIFYAVSTIVVVLVLVFFIRGGISGGSSEEKEKKREENTEEKKPEEKPAEEQPKKQDDNTETIKGITFKMIQVEGGTFMIGCTPEQGSDCYDNEKKTKQITLTSYQIGETEVTQALWRAVMGSNLSKLHNKNCDECPVENVSYEDIVNDFLPKLNQITGKTYRLPTEAEWEYAARGGNKATTQTKYAGSNNVEEVAWYDGNYKNSKHGTQGSTHPVAQLKANALGLYDMSGNVWEWCNDWYVDSYDKYPSSSGADRVIRGGAWLSTARGARVAYRFYSTPSYRNIYVGFRLCRADR